MVLQGRERCRVLSARLCQGMWGSTWGTRMGRRMTWRAQGATRLRAAVLVHVRKGRVLLLVLRVVPVRLHLPVG